MSRAPIWHQIRQHLMVRDQVIVPTEWLTGKLGRSLACCRASSSSSSCSSRTLIMSRTLSDLSAGIFSRSDCFGARPASIQVLPIEPDYPLSSSPRSERACHVRRQSRRAWMGRPSSRWILIDLPSEDLDEVFVELKALPRSDCPSCSF